MGVIPTGISKRDPAAARHDPDAAGHALVAAGRLALRLLVIALLLGTGGCFGHRCRLGPEQVSGPTPPCFFGYSRWTPLMPPGAQVLDTLDGPVMIEGPLDSSVPPGMIEEVVPEPLFQPDVGAVRQRLRRTSTAID